MANRFSVEAIFKAVDRITQPVKRMQSAVGKFTRSAERSFRKLTKVIDASASALFKLGRRVAAFGVGTVSAGLAAFAVALDQTADAADSLAKTAARLDFPIEELQEWRFVSEQSGVSTSLLEKSLGAFSKRLGEARAGTGALQSMLSKTNPEFLEQLKATTDVSEAFDMYLGLIREAETATDRAALASAGFSRAGLSLVNIALNSADAIKALRIEQRENGVITAAQAAAAEKYNDAVDSLKGSLTGLMRDVLLPLFPTLTKTVRGWRELIVANRELIQTRITEFLMRAGDALKQLFAAAQRVDVLDKVMSALDALVKFIKFINENGATILKWAKWLGLAAVALKAVAVVLGIINVLALANPFGLIVLGVTALVGAVALLVANFGKIKAWFAGLREMAKTLLEPLDLIVKTIGSIAGFNFPGISSLFGSDDETAATTATAQGSLVSPAAQQARMLEEKSTTTRTEVTLRDETGRAEVSGTKTPTGFNLISSGAF